MIYLELPDNLLFLFDRIKYATIEQVLTFFGDAYERRTIYRVINYFATMGYLDVLESDGEGKNFIRIKHPGREALGCDRRILRVHDWEPELNREEISREIMAFWPCACLGSVNVEQLIFTGFPTQFTVGLMPAERSAEDQRAFLNRDGEFAPSPINLDYFDYTYCSSYAEGELAKIVWKRFLLGNELVITPPDLLDYYDQALNDLEVFKSRVAGLRMKIESTEPRTEQYRDSVIHIALLEDVRLRDELERLAFFDGYALVDPDAPGLNKVIYLD